MSEPRQVSEPTDWQAILDDISYAFDSENEWVVRKMLDGMIATYKDKSDGGWEHFRNCLHIGFNPKHVHYRQKHHPGKYPKTERELDRPISANAWRQFARIMLCAYAQWHGEYDAIWHIDDYDDQGHYFLYRDVYPIYSEYLKAKQRRDDNV